MSMMLQVIAPFATLLTQTIESVLPHAFPLLLLATVACLVLRCKENDKAITSLRAEMTANVDRLKSLEKDMEQARLERAAAHKAVGAALQTSEACFVQASAYALEAQKLRSKVEETNKKCRFIAQRNQASMRTQHFQNALSDSLSLDSEAFRPSGEDSPVGSEAETEYDSGVLTEDDSEGEEEEI
mmetsp:Transcript_83372/g.137893  ORF Transcript_83372/g.137893 Transcript_83372/m.137893 type:complete len:185 (+) Transcript_83372:93-647(+)